MRYWRHIGLGVIFWASILWIPRARAHSVYEAVTESQFTKLLQQDCALAIPWASWCSLCLEELPTLLPELKEYKQIKPIVMDLSRTYVQQNFSKPFLEKLELPYTTYRVPKEELEPVFRKKIDPNWNGDLPYAVLFRCEGKKCSSTKQWKGKLSNENIKEIATLCSGKPQQISNSKRTSR